jgi:hypothetical protein
MANTQSPQSIFDTLNLSPHSKEKGRKNKFSEESKTALNAKPSFGKLFGIVWQLFERSEFCHTQMIF